MHGDCSAKTNYYSIIKHSTPESYRKKPSGVATKATNFPHWKHGYLIKSLLISTKLPQLTPLTQKPFYKNHISDWPSHTSTGDLGVKAKEFPPTAFSNRPTRPDTSHSTSAGGGRPVKRPAQTHNRLTNTPDSRPLAGL